MARVMKDSGVAWIGEIPVGWDIVRLKSKFSFGKGLPITKDNLVETGIPVISYGQIHAKYNSGVQLQSDLFRFVNASYLQTNPDALVHRGDIIVADTSEDTDGCGNCAFVDQEMQLFAGYHTVVLKARSSDDNKYFAYLMKTDPWRSQIRSKVSGVKVFSISRKILADAILLCPPISEQSRIAAFLDRRCAEIDRVIAATQRTIEEYKKLKQSIITEAVTRGIRLGRKMKDSGVEWIGEIPEEWKVAKMKRACLRITDGSHFSPESIAEGFPYITAKDVRGVGIDYDKANRISADDFANLQRNGCQPHRGDVLIVKDGATTGRVGLMIDDTACVLLSSVAMLTPSKLIESKFLMYSLQSELLQNQILISMAGSAMPRITLTKLIDYYCVYCSITEQQEIIDYLDERCAEIDRLIEAKQRLLTELEAYKKSVIYEYVTGKKEVPVCQ